MKLSEIGQMSAQNKNSEHTVREKRFGSILQSAAVSPQNNIAGAGKHTSS